VGTSPRCRSGPRVRGLDLHLERLERGSRELFGLPVDRERVRGWLRQATEGLPGDLSVQVNEFSLDDEGVEAGRPVVGGIDGAELPHGGDLLATVRRCYETIEG